jgi:hypothetical protein
MIAQLQISENYWLDFKVTPKDIENIYNLLLENAIPLPESAILDFLVNSRIKHELDLLHKQRTGQGKIYLPKDDYKVGETLLFPQLHMEKGKIISIRDGFNPDFQNLKVIEVEFENGKPKSFASQLGVHSLNHILEDQEKNPNLDLATVKEKYGENLSVRLNESLELNKDLVKIAGNWFPRSLLVDVNIGHLNLAEAVLEEANGGPIRTSDLMKQVELIANADQKLLEFSFDLALQEDGRFDEVGPSGETLWFLKEFEPQDVREIPLYLKYSKVEYSTEGLEDYIGMFESNIYDELEPLDSTFQIADKASISLSFPHWRSGTLPLSKSLKKMFPSAYEAPRVQFTFFGPQDEERFSGWVVRPFKYIYGLDKWYQKHELMPGSLVIVEKSKTAGEIIIRFEKSRQNKEWLKTLLVGSDGGFVFAMLKHSISTSFNERMAIAIPDLAALEEIWKNHVFEKESFEKTVIHVMRELAKLNPQRQVHALELYASVNLFRRCPPSQVLYYLIKNEHVEHLGDLYFRITEKE